MRRPRGNPCRDHAPSQPPANSDGTWRPSPATELAFSGARGSCASPCPLASDKSPGLQRRAKRQRQHSIPIARHHLSGGLAQRDLLTTGRGATPSRAAAWARRARQSKDSLHYGELSIATLLRHSLPRTRRPEAANRVRTEVPKDGIAAVAMHRYSELRATAATTNLSPQAANAKAFACRTGPVVRSRRRHKKRTALPDDGRR